MENLKIKLKCEDMIKYGYIALKQFPKSEKFSLAQDIKRTMFNLLEQIIRTNRSRDKKPLLYEIDTELEILRTQVRLAMELKFLPFSKYEVWGIQLTELGRMLGGCMSFLGYMKHCAGKRSVDSILDQLIFSRGIAPILI